MPHRFLPVLLVFALGGAGCLVRGGEQEVDPAAPATAGAALDPHWRDGTLPPGLDEGEPVRGGTLVVRTNVNPPSLNSLLDSDGWARRITLHNLHEALVRPDPRDHPDYRPIPELAERWEESEDHRTFTFHLRRGVRWHDGRPFTAADVRFTFERLLDPTVRAMHQRQAFELLEGVEAPDPYTVVLHYRAPYVWALEKIADVPILPAHAFEGHEGAAFNTAPYHRAPIGTGPFRFVAWDDQVSITLARFDDYWGEKAHVDRVVYRIVPEPNVAQQLILRGEIDLDISLGSEQFVKLADEPQVVARYHRLKVFDASYSWIGWNHRRPVFEDRRVRRALAMLLDRETLRVALNEGLPLNANCVFYHEGPACDPATEQPAFDPDGAAALLAEAGWRDADGDGVLDRNGVPFRFTMTIPSGNPVNEQMILVYQQQLHRAGIEMELQKIEWSVYVKRLREGEFDACMLMWTMSSVEADPYQLWHSSQRDGGSNYVGYASAEADVLAERIRGTFDREERLALFRRFNQLVIDDAPILLLYHLPRRTVIHRRLRGVHVAPLLFFDLREIWIDPRYGEGA